MLTILNALLPGFSCLSLFRLWTGVRVPNESTKAILRSAPEYNDELRSERGESRVSHTRPQNHESCNRSIQQFRDLFPFLSCRYFWSHSSGVTCVHSRKCSSNQSEYRTFTRNAQTESVTVDSLRPVTDDIMHILCLFQG